jgi:hypothetical protein
MWKVSFEFGFGSEGAGARTMNHGDLSRSMPIPRLSSCHHEQVLLVCFLICIDFTDLAVDLSRNRIKPGRYQLIIRGTVEI